MGNPKSLTGMEVPDRQQNEVDEFFFSWGWHRIPEAMTSFTTSMRSITISKKKTSGADEPENLLLAAASQFLFRKELKQRWN